MIASRVPQIAPRLKDRLMSRSALSGLPLLGVSLAALAGMTLGPPARARFAAGWRGGGGRGQHRANQRGQHGHSSIHHGGGDRLAEL